VLGEDGAAIGIICYSFKIHFFMDIDSLWTVSFTGTVDER